MARSTLTLNCTIDRARTFEDMKNEKEILIPPSKHTLENALIHTFCNMPGLKIPVTQNPPEIVPIKELPIVLLHGSLVTDRNGSGGFGFVHIIDRHEKELRQAGVEISEEGIIFFIEEILFSGLSRICFDCIEGKKIKVAIVSSAKGTAIVQYKDNFHWSIVTAFRKNHIDSTILKRHLFKK